jgi:hypothetical protein
MCALANYSYVNSLSRGVPSILVISQIARGSGTSPARLWRVPNQPYGADTPLLPGGAWGSCGDSSRRLPWSPATSPSRRKSATLRWIAERDRERRNVHNGDEVTQPTPTR